MPRRFPRLVELIDRLRPQLSASKGEAQTGETGADETLGPVSLSEFDRTAVEALRQGDIIDVDCLPVRGLHGQWQHQTPYGAALLTQTCDAVRLEKPTTVLAPIAILDDDRAAKDARDNKVLRYVNLPAAGPDVFVDMSIVATVDKAEVILLRRGPGVDPDDDMAVRTLGRAIGRRFSRFAFPDDVVYWLDPLERVVDRKHDKSGPEAEALELVHEFRVEAGPNWQAVPYSLTLCVIVKEDVLPSYADDQVPPCPPALETWLRNDDGTLIRGSAEIAEKLMKESRESPSSGAIYSLWLALAESWAALCVPDRKRMKRLSPERVQQVMSAVSGIDADVIDEHGFSTFRYRRSEQLDLDHLSPPLPE